MVKVDEDWNCILFKKIIRKFLFLLLLLKFSYSKYKEKKFVF